MKKTSLENLGFAAAAAGIPLAFAIISINIWNADLGIPFEYHWDSLYSESVIKSLLDNGSFFSNPDLGAPYGQDGIDFYPGGITTYLVAIVMGLLTDSWALIINLIWLGGFAAVGATTWWVMYSLGVPRIPALVAAVLFAILPYHFWRGEAGLIMSGYFVVPLTGWLALKVLGGHSLFTPGKRDGPSNHTANSGGTVLVVIFCLLIAIGSVYHAIFSILLIAGISILALLVAGKRRAGMSGLVATGLIALFTLVSLTPSLIYRTENGSNSELTQREPRESDFYGLSLSQMVMPATNHRFQQLASAKQRFLSETITPSEDSQALGLMGTIGLGACLLSLLVLPIGKPRWVEPLLTQSGVVVLLAFLLGTIGGLAIMIATFLSPQIRAWNRLSIFIGFFALVGFALILARVFSWLDARTGKVAPSYLLGGVLLLFGLWDQTPARWPEQFQHDLIAREFRGDQALVERMEEVLPENALVFQIPYLEYPEGFPPPGRIDDYDPLRGYLHSNDLQWSYGAIKGRRADIAFCVRDLPIRQLVPVIKAWGFSALWIDLDGYSKQDARRRAAVAAQVTTSNPLRDRSGRFLVFPLEEEEGGPLERTSQLLRRSLPGDSSAPQNCDPIERALSETGF